MVSKTQEIGSEWSLGIILLGWLLFLHHILGLGRQKFHILADDFGDIPSGTFRIIIGAASDFTLDKQFISLMDISLSNFGKASPQHDIVPFRAVGHYSTIGQCIAFLCRSERKCRHGLVGLVIPDFWFFTHIADEHDFVHDIQIKMLFPHSKILELEVLSFCRGELAAAVNPVAQMFHNPVVAVKS